MVAASALVLLVAIFIMNTVGTQTLEYNGEGESAKAFELVDDGFEFNSAPTEQLVFSNPSVNAQDPAFRSTVQNLVAQLDAPPETESVVSYYGTGDPGMVSDDGHVVLAQVVIAEDTDDAEDKVETILAPVPDAATYTAGYEIAIAGDISLGKQVEDIEKEDFQSMIVITMILALTFMLIAFRGVVAAALPLILAIGSIFTALGIAALVSHVYPMIEFLAQVVLLMGMAVGVDYSLFVVSRYRNEGKAGRPKLEAITVAINTTGRAVFYAGVTVLLSLVGLMFTGSDIFISMSIGVIIVVSLALIASLTLLPAMLSVLGDKVDWLRLPFIGRESNNGGGFWGAITDRVLARPVALAMVTAGALIALAIPVLSMNLGFASGSDSYHDAVEGKRALELLEEHFSSGLAQPAYVVVEDTDVKSSSIQNSVERLINSVQDDGAFLPPFDVTVNEAGNILFVEVPLTAGVDEDEGENSIRHLRQDIIPEAFNGSTAQVMVTGASAGSLDFTDKMVNSAPYVFGFVLGLAFLLLLVMFRSIIIPIKAIGLNLLSVGASLGVVVMVFQWGWGISILGSDATGVIGGWLPLFLFAILFGLSMDYHMLVLGRIKEAHDQGHTNEEAVSRGIKLTAGQITSAAAIMVGVFATFGSGTRDRGAANGVGTGCGDTDRRNCGPLGAAAGFDEAAWRAELVPAVLA